MILTKKIGDYMFHYTGHAQRKLYMGVEWEMDSNRPRIDGDEVAQKIASILKDGGLTTTTSYDGSLENGKELITHPATLDVYKQLTPHFLKAFRVLIENNFTDLNNKTGGHIHISKRVFGKDLITRENNIRRLVAWVYREQDSFKKFSMRDSRWATYTSTPSRDKYVAVNTLHTSTIEFRMFSGYKMFNNLIANLELVELVAMTLTTGSVRVLENFSFDALITAYKRTHKDAYYHWLSVK
jgi:hypothetical protein